MREYDSFDEEAVQSYHFTESQSDKNTMSITNFTSKSFLNNNDSIMSDSTE